jgi:hypothetical protein
MAIARSISKGVRKKASLANVVHKAQVEFGGFGVSAYGLSKLWISFLSQ